MFPFPPDFFTVPFGIDISLLQKNKTNKQPIMKNHDFTKKPNRQSVQCWYKSTLLHSFSNLGFFSVVLEPLLTVEDKTSVPSAKVTEDSKPSFVLIQNNQK